MKRLLRWIGAAVALALVLGAALAVQVIWFRPFSIDLFFERVFIEFALKEPELLSSLRLLEPLGLRFHNDDLSDASIARTRELQAKVDRDLATLRAYDYRDLSPSQQLSYAVLEHYLSVAQEGQRFAFHDYPLTQLSGVHLELPAFMANIHQVNDKRDAEHYIARLEKFPVKFGQVLEGLELRAERDLIPPRFAVIKAQAQMEAFIDQPPSASPLYAALSDKLDAIDSIDPTGKQRLLNGAQRAIENRVYPAYRALISHLEGLRTRARTDHGVWKLPDGEAYYRHRIKQHTTTDLGPAEVHQLGLAEVARIEAEMDAILRAHGHVAGTIGARLSALGGDPRFLYPPTDAGRSQIIEDFQRIIDQMDSSLEPYFDLRPRTGVEVRRMPPFREQGAPSAYYQGPAMDGSRPGVFYVNLRDVREIPKFGMRTLAYHEAIPGHHFQIGIRQELADVPTFRRLIPFAAFSEGWALYSERLAAEMGLLADPYDDLGRLQAEMFRAARLVVDSGLHHQRWSREQAIEYLQQKTGMPEGDVVAEVERYLVRPGQALAYKVGMLKILELRERARAALEAVFDIREFHNVVLTQGSLPLDLLQRQVDAYVADAMRR